MKGNNILVYVNVRLWESVDKWKKRKLYDANMYWEMECKDLN